MTQCCAKLPEEVLSSHVVSRFDISAPSAQLHGAGRVQRACRRQRAAGVVTGYSQAVGLPSGQQTVPAGVGGGRADDQSEHDTERDVHRSPDPALRYEADENAPRTGGAEQPRSDL